MISDVTSVSSAWQHYVQFSPAEGSTQSDFHKVACAVAFPANIPVEKHEGGSPVRDGVLTDGFWDVENNTTYEPH